MRTVEQIAVLHDLFNQINDRLGIIGETPDAYFLCQSVEILKQQGGTIDEQATRITELEAQQSDLQEMHNALATNQSIWPNNWCQQVAMIAYHFYLMEAQLADANKDAERYQRLRRDAVELSLSNDTIAMLLKDQTQLDAAMAEGKQA